MEHITRNPTLYTTALVAIQPSLIDQLERELPEGFCTSGESTLFVDIDEYCEFGEENALLEAIIAEAKLDVNTIGLIQFIC